MEETTKAVASTLLSGKSSSWATFLFSRHLTCRLSFMLVLTAGFFVAELVSGYVGNSIALISDSFSMLSDLVALCVGLATGRLSRRKGPRSPAASFGSGRAEVVGALSNAVFLAALYFTILVEALQRLAQPQGIRDAFLVLLVGALGLAVNLLGLLAWLGHAVLRCFGLQLPEILNWQGFLGVVGQNTWGLTG
uniref:Cation efflux protein transmembrane domain-containing protein n=1 Tax=Anolis carolinensis TaxID=28377 RepID=A0A803TCP4_ANOCA